MTLYLRTLAEAGYRVVGILPGNPNRDHLGFRCEHRSVAMPSALFWPGLGLRNAVRAIRARLRTSRQVYAELRRIKPHVTLCVGPDAWFLGVLLSRRLGGAAIACVHETYEDKALAFPGWLQPLVRAIVRWGLRILALHTNALLHVSPERKAHYRFLRQEGSVVIYYPELSRFPSPAVRDARTKPVVFLHAGALRAQYAAAQLLEAVASLALRRKGDFVVRVIGGVGPGISNASLIPELEAAGVLQIRRSVPHSHVVDEMQRCHAGITLILPIDTGHRLAQPRKLYEYLASGLPVVAADLPTLRRVLTQYECGILVDPGAPAAISAALEWIIDSPVERARMGANGRRAVEERFNWEAERGRLLELVARAAQGRDRVTC